MDSGLQPGSTASPSRVNIEICAKTSTLNSCSTDWALANKGHAVNAWIPPVGLLSAS